VEAEALGYPSTFVVEHHFTGYGQVSASLNLLTWVAARSTTLRLGTAVVVLPWHNPVLRPQSRVGGGARKSYPAMKIGMRQDVRCIAVTNREIIHIYSHIGSNLMLSQQVNR
jgi:hypothetical protein